MCNLNSAWKENWYDALLSGLLAWVSTIIWKQAGGYFGRTHPLGQTSGSEDLYESSMESIESNSATSGLTLHPLSALNQSAVAAVISGASAATTTTSGSAGNSKKLQKISSSDSLMCMIKNLATNRLSASTPSR